MNIIIVGTFRFPYFDAAAARVLNVGKTFKACGHEVEYIAMGGNQVKEHLLPDGSFSYQGFHYTVTNEIDCRNILSKVWNKLKRGEKILKILRIRDLHNTLVIAYNPTNNFIKKLIKLSKIKHFKLAVDLTEWYDRNELPLTDWWSYHKCMTNTLHKVPNKIVISSYFAKYYHSNNIIIPSTCDIDDEKWDRSNDAVDPFEGVTLIYAGNPAKKDLVHTAVNAVNHLAQSNKKIRFLILGISRKDYIKRYGSLLDCEMISENIVFMGKVAQNDVPAYYKHADYMVLLRENNQKSNAGFPTKFAESMTAGIPVIANPTSDIGHILKDGVNGYLLKNETLDCVESLLNRISTDYNPSIIATHKANAKKTGRSVFDYHNYIYSLNLFINKLQ